MLYPAGYKTRIRDHSKVSPGALLVALTIADERTNKHLKPHEPLRTMTVDDIAARCHMGRTTVKRHLAELVQAGWLACREVYRDGRQQPSEYRLADPTSNTEVQNGPQYRGPNRTLNRGPNRTPVVRSNYLGESDTVAPQAADVGDESPRVKVKTPPDAPRRERRAPFVATDPTTWEMADFNDANIAAYEAAQSA